MTPATYFGIAIIVAYVAAVSYAIGIMAQSKEPHLSEVLIAIMIGWFWPITGLTALVTVIVYLFYLTVLYTAKKIVKIFNMGAGNSNGK